MQIPSVLQQRLGTSFDASQLMQTMLPRGAKQLSGAVEHFHFSLCANNEFIEI